MIVIVPPAPRKTSACLCIEICTNFLIEMHRLLYSVWVASCTVVHIRHDDTGRRPENWCACAEKSAVESSLIKTRYIHYKILPCVFREERPMTFLIPRHRIESARILPHSLELVRTRIGMRDNAFHISTFNVREAHTKYFRRAAIDAPKKIFLNKYAVKRNPNDDKGDHEHLPHV